MKEPKRRSNKATVILIKPSLLTEDSRKIVKTVTSKDVGKGGGGANNGGGKWWLLGVCGQW